MKQLRQLYITSAALLPVLLVALVVFAVNWAQASAAPGAHVPASIVGLAHYQADDTGYIDSPDATQAVLDLINQERASMNLPALKMSSRLIQSAHLHNIAMFQTDTLSHQLPREPDLRARISTQGVNWWSCAENIAYGWGDATQAVGLNQLMFDERPPDDGHRQNILSHSNVVGIDVIVNTQHSKVWLTEDFARI